LIAYDGALARLRVRCSAGFYVRSMAHDLGAALGSGAILAELVRTEAAGFDLADALPFATLVTGARAELRAQVRPIETLLADMPAATLTRTGVEWAVHGRDLGPRELVAPLRSIPALVRLLGPDGRMVGLAEPAKMPGFLHPAVIFSYN
jgi:tRNA pseudouridine55 synthase